MTVTCDIYQEFNTHTSEVLDNRLINAYHDKMDSFIWEMSTCDLIYVHNAVPYLKSKFGYNNNVVIYEHIRMYEHIRVHILIDHYIIFRLLQNLNVPSRKWCKKVCMPDMQHSVIVKIASLGIENPG